MAGAAGVIPLAAAGVIAATGSPAAAYPNLCTIPSRTIDYTAGSAYTQCMAGSGWFQVRIACKPTPSSRLTAYYFGPWVSVSDGRNGKQSKEWCSSEYPYIVGAGNVLS